MSKLAGIVAVLVSSLLVAGAPPRAAAQDAPAKAAPAPQRTEESPLRTALAPSLAAKNVAFDSTSTTTKPAASDAGEAGGDAKPAGGEGKGAAGAKGDEELSLTGASLEGAPTQLKRGALAAFVRDHAMVFRRGEGAQAAWELWDPASAGSNVPGGDASGAERPRRKRDGGDDGEGSNGGNGGKGGKGGKGGRGAPQGQPGETPIGATATAAGGPGSGMLRRSLAQLATAIVPRDLLATIAAEGGDVKREMVDGKPVLRGVLSAAGAEKLSGAGAMLRLVEQAGRARPAQTFAGTFEVTLGADGLVENVVVETKVTGGARGERSRKLAMKLHGWNTTSYEVPKEALALLPK